MKLLRPLTGALALGVAALLVTPPQSHGFNLLGHSLGQGQRDFRVFNNFDNNAANNNTTPEGNFPGALGAVLAIWKGCVEWGSGPHGNGASDDTTQFNIGDGNANFDPSFQGENNSNGGNTGNTHAQINSDNPGVFAFQSGGSNGWRIRYHQNWTWADGPGLVGGNQADLQGIGCHEYGHALGLAHSQFGGVTMQNGGTGNDTSLRSIEPDDIAGLQAIYGVKSAGKPEITGVAWDEGSNTLTITGVNFLADGNEVWFTQAGIGGNGTPIKALDVATTGGLGEEIVLTPPGAAGQGDVLVRTGSGGAGLSNAYPWLTDDVAIPGPPVITDVTPSATQVIWPFEGQLVTLTGTEFDDVASLTVDGVDVPDFDVVDDNTIEFTMPILDDLGPAEIEATSFLGSGTSQIQVTAPASPVLRLNDGEQPSNMGSFFPAVIRMGGQPENAVFLWISLSNQPTPVPGLFDLDIGNFAQNLFYLGSFTIEAKGWTETQFQFGPGLTVATPIYWQSVEYDIASPAFPSPASNVSEGRWTF